MPVHPPMRDVHLPPSSTIMNPAYNVASKESEALQRAGTTVTIFAISLFGMSCPALWRSFNAQ
jgi:hypothetical protein